MLQGSEAGLASHIQGFCSSATIYIYFFFWFFWPQYLSFTSALEIKPWQVF
jgi:hypothetical protein